MGLVALSCVSGPDNSIKLPQSFSNPPLRYECDKQAAFDAGAQGYLVKLVGIDDLLPEVERLIVANGRLYRDTDVKGPASTRLPTLRHLPGAADRSFFERTPLWVHS